MKGFNELNKFKNLKFYSRNRQQILEALELFEQLGYSVVDEYFNSEEAEDGEGLCVWDDGEITEGWLDDKEFEQVTLDELKEMVGEDKEVLWLNIETLEERVINDGKKFYSDIWVKVPEGATFATGDKDSFSFRKDGWYYNNQTSEWIKGDVTLKNLHTHEFVKLFWIKSDIRDNVFTLERLLGCEVLVKTCFGDYSGHVIDIIYKFNALHVESDRCCNVVKLENVLFFTEDGDELTFDEYITMYYG